MKNVRKFGRLCMGLLREMADENAYRRHLAAHGRTHSPAEWRRFWEAHLNARFTRPKCC